MRQLYILIETKCAIEGQAVLHHFAPFGEMRNMQHLHLPFGKLPTPEGVSGAEGVSQGSSQPAFVNEKRCK